MRSFVSLCVAVSCSATFATTSHAVSLTGYFKLDDTSLSTTSAAVGSNGTYSTGFAVGDLNKTGSPGDPSGRSVEFPTAGTQRIEVPSAGGISDGTNFSITMWTQFAGGSLSRDHALATNVSSWGAGNLLLWRDDSGGGSTNHLAALVDGDPRANGITNSLNNDTDWQLVALTYDNTGANEQVYVNGVNVNANAPGPDGALTTSATITLGNVAGGTLDGSKQFQGFMDEVGFWDRALTSGELAALFFFADDPISVEDDFLTDAAGAATLFNFYETSSSGDQLDFLGLTWENVADVAAFGGTAQQSTQVGDVFVLGLQAGGSGGLVGQTPVPEPTSIALWILMGLGLARLGFRRWPRQ